MFVCMFVVNIQTNKQTSQFLVVLIHLFVCMFVINKQINKQINE